MLGCASTHLKIVDRFLVRLASKIKKKIGVGVEVGGLGGEEGG